MGCFNVACNLSGLPICHGDRIKLLITIPPMAGSKATSLCYPGDIRTPCFLPISGKYDDYGAIEEVVEDNNTALIVSFFKEAEINKWLRFSDRKRDGVNNLKEIEWWIDNIACEGFTISTHSQVLRLKSDGDHMSLSFVRQDVWDQYQMAIDPRRTFRKKMVEDTDAWFDWFKGLTSKLNTRVEAYPGENWSMNQYWGQGAAGPTRTKDLGIDNLVKMGFIHFVQTTNGSIDRHWLETIYFINHFQPLFAGGHLTDKNDPKWSWFRNSCVEFYTICNVMRTVPLFWMPTMIGNQDAAFNLVNKLATVNQKITAKVIAQHKLENS